MTDKHLDPDFIKIVSYVKFLKQIGKMSHSWWSLKILCETDLNRKN